MKRFKRVYIEITNICNLQCSFCPDSGRDREFMGEELFTAILDQINGLTDYIYLHVKGEPLLHPQIERVLELCTEKGFRVNIATNGTVIGRVSEILLSSRAVRQVSFSLHSLDGLNDITAAKRLFDDIISFANEAQSRTGIIIEFKLWNLGSGGSAVNSFIIDEISRRYNIYNDLPERETNGKGIGIGERIYLSRARQFVWPDISSGEISTGGFCYGLKTQVAILVDGTVVPCCLDGCGVIRLGNVKEIPLSEIIISDRSAAILRGFSERRAVEPLCRRCGYRGRFDRK